MEDRDELLEWSDTNVFCLCVLLAFFAQLLSIGLENFFVLKMVLEKRQHGKDRNAFAVVLGTGVAAAGKPNSTGLLVVGGDVLSLISTFLIWEKVKLQCEWKVPGDGSVWSCHISPCSRIVLTSSGPELHLWDTTSGLLKQTLKSNTGGVRSVVLGCRFFPDGKTVVSASSDSTLKVWDVASGSLIRTLVGHLYEVSCVDVSPDNARILSGSFDQTWKIWNSRTGELQHTEEVDDSDQTSHCCSFSPNGSLFLFGCGCDLKLHDSTSYQLQHTLTMHSDIVESCSFSPDGATMLSSSHDHTMNLWSTTTGQCLRTLDGYSGSVCSCSFSPSGHAIYSASNGTRHGVDGSHGTLMVWTAATGQLEGIFDEKPSTALSICASPDGQRIVSGYDDGTVKIFSVLASLKNVRHGAVLCGL
jgi:WD40 repeat protein